ncbi:MAG: leucyl aminopeptidase [Abditibacteriota bacterium]|nr:leucyl aminopeptidase [Abditibacteriota bacterium]
MNFEVQFVAPSEFETPCLIVPIWQGEEFNEIASAIDEKLGGLIQSVRDEDGFKAANGEVKVLYTPSALPAARVLLLGLGKRDKWSSIKLRHAAARAARAARSIKREEFAFIVPQSTLEAPESAQAITEGILLGLHIFNDFKTDEETKSLTQLQNVTLLASDQSTLDAVQAGIQSGQLAAEATLRARAWVNMPSNRKSPQFLALVAQKIAEENNLRCEIWDENKVREEKMDALYGVGMGSDNPPRFIILDYAPPGKEQDAPIILVGKGMSFDSGGYSLKPSPSMEDMKDDMAGAAVVLGSMSAIAQLQPNQRVMALVPSAENMISGRAQRPGDIVTARNGKTIEVLNTDAEGRLILADALSYATEQNPKAIIDFATLTGAIGVALGQVCAGLVANDDALSAKIVQSGERTGDRVWALPLWDEYRDAMKGTVSDLRNITSDRYAGSITAAVFLEKFVGENIPWAHLDIASVALIREERPLSMRGATGFGVRLVLDLLANWEED